MRRAVLIVLVVAGLVPASAQAWTWPVNGKVLRPFAFGGDPYAAGQHRGIDVAGDLGSDVDAPASGVVSFAGTVPTGGKTLSIRTADGYTATMQHLGSILVKKGDSVVEGAVVATVGTSGAPEEPEPYVYLGIRVSADDQGYVDPLTLLPARLASPAPDPGGPAAHPGQPPAPSSPPATAPAPPAAPHPPAHVSSPPPPVTQPSASTSTTSAVDPSAAPAPAAPPAPPAQAAPAPPAAATEPAATPATTADPPGSAPAASNDQVPSTPGALPSLPSAGGTPGIAAIPTRAAISPIRGQSAQRPTRPIRPVPTPPVHGPAVTTLPTPAIAHARHAVALLARRSAEDSALSRSRVSRLEPRVDEVTNGQGTLPLGRIGIAAGLALVLVLGLLLRRRRRQEPGPGVSAAPDLPPMINRDAVLRDDAHLLRERRAAHRPRVYDHRGRHRRPAPQAARGRDVLPDRDRRTRHEGAASCRGRGCVTTGVRRPHLGRVARALRPGGRGTGLLHQDVRSAARGVRA